MDMTKMITKFGVAALLVVLTMTGVGAEGRKGGKLARSINNAIASNAIEASEQDTRAIMALVGKTDANLNLMVTGGAAGAAADSRAIGNLIGKVDANGFLFVTLAGGTVTTADGLVNAPAWTFASEPTSGIFRNGAGDIRASIAGSSVWGWSAGALNLFNGAKINFTSGTSLFEDAANALAQRNVANAQTFNIYNTTDGTNKEYASFTWAESANRFRLSLQKTGTGTRRPFDITDGATSLMTVDPVAASIGFGSSGTTFSGSTGAITKIAGVTTNGTLGVPVVVATGRSTAQTAAVVSVSAFTNGAADGSYEISANVLVTTATTHAFTVTCAYTDEGNTARTLTLTFSQLAGTLGTSIANAAGAVPYEGVPLHIRVKASTTITIATTGTFTTVTYNVEGIIKKTT